MRVVVLALLVVLGFAQTPNVDYVAYNYRRDYLLTTHNTGNTRKQNRYEGWELLVDASGNALPMTYDGSKYAYLSGASADGTSYVPTPSTPVIIRYRFRQNWNQLKNVISVVRTGSADAVYATWTSQTTATLSGTTVTLTGTSGAGWAASGCIFNVDAAYLNGFVSSSPATPNSCLTFSTAASHTLTFSPAVERPLMAISSLGAAGTDGRLVFDHDFVVVSQGNGNYGTGTYTKVGTTLTGREFHGLIQFVDTVSTLQANYPFTENYSAINVGKLVNQAAQLNFRLNTNTPYWTALIAKGETQTFTATINGAPAVLENEFFDLKTTVFAAPLAGEKFNLEWKIVAPCEEPCTCFYCTTEFTDFCPTVEPTPAPTPAQYMEDICSDAWDECYNILYACFDMGDNNANLGLDCLGADASNELCVLEAACNELDAACQAFAMHCDTEVEGCPQ